MRPPDRKRQPPRVIQPPPLGVDVAELAARVSYTGSPEHKNATTFAGRPRPRADATICDSSFADRLQQIQLWLRTAIRMQCFAGPWENGFPRYVWYKSGDTVFQGRLVNRVSGQYKGWQLSRDEWPGGIDQFDWERRHGGD